MGLEVKPILLLLNLISMRILFFLLLTHYLFAQEDVYFNYMYDYENTLENYFSLKYSDEGFWVSEFFFTPTGVWGYGLRKIDNKGKTLLRKSYTNDNITFTNGYWVKDKQENLVLSIGKRDLTTENAEYVLMEFDELGDTVWQKSYNWGTAADIPKKTIQTKDKGFLISGFTQNTENGREDAYLVKTDSLGNLEWQETYGRLERQEGADHALQTADGGYLVLGERLGSGIRQDVWLFKIDSSGNFMWEKVYTNPYHQQANEMIEVEDGYLIVGYDQAGEIGKVRPSGLLMKVDKEGNYLWERTYTGSIFNLELTDQFRAINELSDGSLIIVGSSENENEYAYHMGLLMKLTAEGDTIWTKTYSNNLNDDHYFWDVEVLEDGGFGICGWGYGVESGTQDGWILKVDSLGNTCQPANCDSIFTTSIHYEVTTHYPTSFYPNPAQNRVTFQHQLPKGKEAVLEVYDLKGELMVNYQLLGVEEELVLEVEDWKSGLYLYRMSIEGKEVSSGKLVVE